VNKKIERSYLEICSLNDLKESKRPSTLFSINIIENPDFQLNKFFYKNIGKKHNWVDRLAWSDKQWIEYISNNNVKTFILKKEKEYVGFFELIFHRKIREVEIAYLGLLEEYQNQKLGSYLLSVAIKNSFLNNPKRVWVHTCSLDHKNALNNYKSRGMKIFKTESIII
jgi:ribosomal protein S18 acetylase RimI-like enzyme|tara:strand:+ start:676 stop:1179 length:504 start_codon:yes stop_codon:yes gene_type:complete